MGEKRLTDILELSEMLVGDKGSGFLDAGFLDTSLLMYMARYNEYACVEDVIADGKTPRRVKLQIHIYVEDLDE